MSETSLALSSGASDKSFMEKFMSSPTVERHLSRASGSAVLAFVAATVAYGFKGVHWALSHIWELQTAAFNNFIGVIDWMGGPMDVGFYAFLASEGIQSMVFATLERNEWRRRLEEERAKREADVEEERAKREAAEEKTRELEFATLERNEWRRQMEEERAKREAAEEKTRELEKQLAEYKARRDDS